MSQNEPTETMDAPPSVEEVWKTLLKDHGVEEEVAENFVAMLEGDPRIALGSPDNDTISTVVENLLETTDLTDFGEIDENDEDRIKSTMVAELESGLQGDRPGPAVARSTKLPSDDSDGSGASGGGAVADAAAGTESEGAAAEMDFDQQLVDPDTAQAYPGQPQPDQIARPEDVDPETIAVHLVLGNAEVRAQIQDDLDQVGVDLNDIDQVAAKIAESAIENYKRFLRDTLFPAVEEHKRQLGYELLVEERMKQLFERPDDDS